MIYAISQRLILLLMSIKKPKLFYNSPLNISHTIDLPSNLLQSRRMVHALEVVTPMNNPMHFSPKEDKTPPKIKKQALMVVQEKNKSRRSVLYKRLTDIKSQNQELEKYSYSKLLSKMVVIDTDGNKNKYKTTDWGNDNLRSISEYSCLRGKFLNMQCDESPSPSKSKSRQRYTSNLGDYANRTIRIFRRYYMPNSQTANSSIYDKSTLDQKYIYINGKKTECKRIHNFYTSQNFRQSYDKAFSKTKDSFFSRKQRQ